MSDSELEKAGIFVHTNGTSEFNCRADAHHFLEIILEKYEDDAVLNLMPRLVYGPFPEPITKEITEMSRFNSQFAPHIRMHPASHLPQNNGAYPENTIFLEDVTKRYGARAYDRTTELAPDVRLSLAKQLMHAMCIFYKEGGLLQDMDLRNMFITPFNQLVIFDLDHKFTIFDPNSVPNFIQNKFLFNIAEYFTNFADTDLRRYYRKYYNFNRKLGEVTKIFNSCNGNITIFEQKILAYIESLYLNKGELRVKGKNVNLDEFIDHLET